MNPVPDLSRRLLLASVTFSAMAAPTLANAAAMATTTAGSVMTANFSDASKLDFKPAYQPFFLTGDLVADGNGGKLLASGYVDIRNQPILDTTVAGKERQFFSDSPDGTSLLSVPNAKVAGVKGNAVFAVVQFEYTTWAQDGTTGMYGRLPSPIAVLTLDQDPATGKLALVKYHNVDTGPANGLWITCGAGLSPWGTHLSSEEYEPNAFPAATDAQFKAFSKNLYGSESLQLRPPARGDGQRRRHRLDQEALLPGPHLAQLPLGIQRRQQGAVARDVDPGGRRIDRSARGRRDQRLDLHHEQFPACGRLGRDPQRRQADARSAGSGRTTRTSLAPRSVT